MAITRSTQNWTVGKTVKRSGEKSLQQLFEYCSPIPFTGCMVWTDRSLSEGYGQVRHAGQRWLAHKLAYELANGPVPEGLELDHLCRVRCCINPEHLEPVTRKVNVIRGDSPLLSRQRQVSKTHCRHGHEFSPENTYVRPNGDRLCRTCHREQVRRAAAKAQQHATTVAAINDLLFV